MGWAVGYDDNWNRDVGYGVPAECDHPKCSGQIDRGLAYVCGSDPFGGEFGCGLYFCEAHLYSRTPRGADRSVQLCPRCMAYRPPYAPSPDVEEWISWKLTDESWADWRRANPDKVEMMQRGHHATEATA